MKHKRLDKIFSSTLFGSPVKKEEGIYCSDEVLTIVDWKEFNKSQEIEMSICTGSIHLCLKNIDKFKSPITIHYYSDQDIISIRKERGILTINDVYDSLIVPIPRDELSSYHVDLIDSSDNRKPIELEMKKGLTRSCDFDIINEKDKFVLQKKKR